VARKDISLQGIPRKRLDSRISQFILEYKGEEVEEPPDELIEALIIDFNLDA